MGFSSQTPRIRRVGKAATVQSGCNYQNISLAKSSEKSFVFATVINSFLTTLIKPLIQPYPFFYLIRLIDPVFDPTLLQYIINH